MNTEQVIQAVREAIRQHVGDRKELLEELMTEADGWDGELEDLELNDGTCEPGDSKDD